ASARTSTNPSANRVRLLNMFSLLILRLSEVLHERSKCCGNASGWSFHLLWNERWTSIARCLLTRIGADDAGRAAVHLTSAKSGCVLPPSSQRRTRRSAEPVLHLTFAQNVRNFHPPAHLRRSFGCRHDGLDMQAIGQRGVRRAILGDGLEKLVLAFGM